jgi:hypothetical protein
MDYYEQKYHEQILQHLTHRAAALGLELVPIEQQPAENNPSVPAPLHKPSGKCFLKAAWNIKQRTAQCANNQP